MQIRPWQIKHASDVVTQGGVIAYPTEAVYGLGCDPLDRVAVERILRVKRRPVSKGLIVIASEFDQLLPYINFPDQATFERVMKTWPGPHTWILPASEFCPIWLRGDHEGLAVRVTAHPICRALCDHAGPLVSTSANRAGKSPARMPWQAQIALNQAVDYILPGETDPNAEPSTIRDALTDQRLR